MVQFMQLHLPIAEIPFCGMRTSLHFIGVAAIQTQTYTLARYTSKLIFINFVFSTYGAIVLMMFGKRGEKNEPCSVDVVLLRHGILIKYF